MNVLFQSSWTTAGLWIDELRRQAPEITFLAWPDAGDPAGIDAALVWQPPDGLFDGMDRLRLIQVLGAGVDSIVESGVSFPDVPVTRVVDPVMSQRMAEYVLYGVLRFHRRFDLYERDQRAAHWERRLHPDPAQVRVGIMGTGEIGRTTAMLVKSVGYEVVGWSRSGIAVPGLQVYGGSEGFKDFLAHSDVLICLLPLTGSTRGILNATTFAGLPSGSFVINAARGGHMVERDLIAALDSGRLGGAMLDVFETEPLPATNPLWRHEKVLITPHSAGITNPRTAVAGIVDNLRRLGRGDPLTNIVDLKRGY